MRRLRNVWNWLRNWSSIGIVAFVITLIASITLPIYYYVKDFGNFPRSASPNDWGSFGDFFGGILNPILALFTFVVTVIIAYYLYRAEERRTAEDRNATINPMLVVQNSTFYIYPARHHPFMFHNQVNRERRHPSNESHEDQFTQLTLDIYNIGFASAIEVIFDTSFDSVFFADYLNGMIPHISGNEFFSMTIPTNAPSEHYYLEHSIHENFSPYFYKDEERIELSHLLPVTIVQKPFSLLIPTYITGLYAVFVYNTMRKSVSADIPNPSFPRFTILIEYKDMRGTTFRQSFEVSFDYIYHHTHELEIITSVKALPRSTQPSQ